MPYMVTYNTGPDMRLVPADTAQLALEIGEQAEASGAENVEVEKLGDDKKLPLSQFAVQYCSRNKRFGEA